MLPLCSTYGAAWQSAQCGSPGASQWSRPSVAASNGTAAANVKIDIENQPQFQEEWRRLKSQLDAQYTNLLNEYKQELTEID